MGLLYIGLALRSRGFDVDFLDLETEGLNPNQFDSHTAWIDACLQQIARRDPFDLIGLGPILASIWSVCARICKIVKDAFPNKLLVVGGPQISANSPMLARTFLQISQADLAVIGDGEWALSDIATKLKGNEDPSQVPGVVSLRSPDFLHRPLIKDLDLFPLPARDLAMPTRRQYKLAKRRQFEVVNRISVPEYQNLPTATLMISRGCVYSCAFCGTERCRRVHSINRVLDDLEMCVKLGFHYFMFFDDLFIGPGKKRDRSINIHLQGHT